MHHLVETLVDVDRHIVNPVLHSVAFDLLCLTEHSLLVFRRNLVGESLHALARLHIDKPVRLVAIVQLQLLVAVVGVKQQHFVFAVTQMAQGVEERLLLVVADKGVGENYHQRAAFHFFGKQVYGFGYIAATQLDIFAFDRPNELFEQRFEIALVDRAGAHFGLEFDGIGKKGNAESIALTQKQFDDESCAVDREGELVGLIENPVTFERKIHRRRLVYQNLAAEVCFLLEPLDKQLVGACIELPVDIARRFAGIVEPMLGKLDRKTVKGALVEPRNKSLYHLLGKEIQGFIFFQLCKHGWRNDVFLEDSVEFAGEGFFGDEADRLVDDGAVFDEKHRGDAADAEFA